MKAKVSYQGKKIGLAVSGGVDSGVAAWILKEAGAELTLFHLRLFSGQEGEKMAKDLAKFLGVKIKILDCREEFEKGVVNYFIREYGLGRTPNPCVVCNKKIKFGRLWSLVKEAGNDFLATGHYVRVVDRRERNGDYQKFLATAKDSRKDQSYFLFGANEFLDHLIFPLAERSKQGVKKIARKEGLPVAESRESEDVCFLKGMELGDFLAKKLKDFDKKGEVLDGKGRLVGEHLGFLRYTIGQRKGIEFNASYRKKFVGGIPPHYVITKLVAKNQLVVGQEKEAFSRTFRVRSLSFREGIKERGLMVKIRSGGNFFAVEKVIKKKIGFKIFLRRKVFAIAPGQMAVFYQRSGDDCLVLGGGEIGG